MHLSAELSRHNHAHSADTHTIPWIN